jgi:hypothetical protein
MGEGQGQILTSDQYYGSANGYLPSLLPKIEEESAAMEEVRQRRFWSFRQVCLSRQLGRSLDQIPSKHV